MDVTFGFRIHERLVSLDQGNIASFEYVFCRHLFTFDELKALQVTLEFIIQLFYISCSHLFGIWKKNTK
jgi:hypothetical protein